ncbi:MAG: UDP-2,3-diacylglucosamine diphosphatase [Gemmatimonadota bacterium]|nr:UDP-2,3-diacylglucosamine diphosphatase [Gemmatimonadota bacterium]
MPDIKPVFLASDAHLGASPPAHHRAFLAWLAHAAGEASEIIINGDLFDFWFEYRWGTTRGHDEVLAILRDIVVSGVPVTLVGGNHDWWGGRYLRDTVGVDFLTEPLVRDIAGRRAFLAHGDGLGDGDHGYRVLKRVLRSRVTRTAFGLLPVSVGDRIAGGVSNTEDRWEQWGERQRERSAALEAWAVAALEQDPELQLVLLGHTHQPMSKEVGSGRWYVNSGDWVFHQSYVVLAPGVAPQLLDWRDR